MNLLTLSPPTYSISPRSDFAMVDDTKHVLNMSGEGIYDEKFIGALTVASYFPLYVLLPILIVRCPLISIGNGLAVAIFFVGVGSAAYSRRIIKNARDRGGSQHTIQNTNDKNQEIVQFIVVYIATFLILRDPSMISGRIVAVIFILFLMTMYTQYKLSLVYNNPVFAFLGYRVYGADVKELGQSESQVRAVVILRGSDEAGQENILLRRVFKDREIYVSTDQ